MSRRSQPGLRIVPASSSLEQRLAAVRGVAQVCPMAPGVFRVYLANPATASSCYVVTVAAAGVQPAPYTRWATRAAEAWHAQNATLRQLAEVAFGAAR